MSPADNITPPVVNEGATFRTPAPKRPMRKSGWFADEPLAEWACIVALAVACFTLVLAIPGPAA